MRNIKFRAWEATEKRFLTWEELQESTVQDVFRLFDCQQFTGFLDKNGKEIFEGDILTDDDDMFIAQWHRDGSWSTWVREGDEAHEQGWFECLLSEWSGNSKIIGNIYETPELLTPQLEMYNAKLTCGAKRAG